MTNFFNRNTTRAILAAGIGILSLTACSDKNEDLSVMPVDASDVKICFTRSGEEGPATGLSDVHLYQFDAETLVKSTSVYDTSAPVTLSTIHRGTLYTLSGLELAAETGVTGREQFAASTVECDPAAGNAPLFYSAETQLSKERFAPGTMEIALTRSVARIDLVNDVDPNITITEAIIEDAPLTTYVFERGSNPDDRTCTFSRSFEEPFTGTGEGMFTIFESFRPVHVRIRGSYDGIPMDMSAAIPNVLRNKIYTLRVVNVGAQVEAAFDVRDWEEGDSVPTGADTSYRIMLDSEKSVFPAGVSVDYEHNLITVPHSGAQGLKLAFKGDTRIDISSVDGLTPAMTYSANDVETVGDGYISSFNLDVAAQGKGRLAYSTYFHLKNALLSGSYDFVEVRVEPSPYQIETVMIGGHEWMCFNATGSDLDDQIYILDGLDSVDEMYTQRFAECVGNYFQYGRSNPFSPWIGNDPALNPLPTDAAERAQHIPWATAPNMPLPEGYHVASFAEWADLLPAGTEVPSEYVARNGENMRVSVVTLPGALSTSSANVNKKNYKMRYFLFESLDSGNKLHIPFAGMKANNKNEIPGSGSYTFENAVTYWVSNDRGVWFTQYKATTNEDGTVTDGATFSESKWNYDGFCPVRGIKD